MLVKAGYDSKQMKIGSMRWRCDLRVVCVDSLEKIDTRVSDNGFRERCGLKEDVTTRLETDGQRDDPIRVPFRFIVTVTQEPPKHYESDSNRNKSNRHRTKKLLFMSDVLNGVNACPFPALPPPLAPHSPAECGEMARGPEPHIPRNPPLSLESQMHSRVHDCISHEKVGNASVCRFNTSYALVDVTVI
ncbi:hypothetical protein EVAR_8865_1 [Eumeta japonica]|uniref:Uncharacterized protein n=1 Tax=Eumeta variegata TaxID=151549 RepID=A0A4C1U060_EUMVA|nr:hypothetical protein EVAR_8865_1 [Eumeta japonica]